jgi:hypothetical protein
MLVYLLLVLFRLLDFLLLIPLLAANPVIYVFTGKLAYNEWYKFSESWQDFLTNYKD